MARLGFPNSFYVGRKPVFPSQPSDITARAGAWIEIDARIETSRDAPVRCFMDLKDGRTLEADTKIYHLGKNLIRARLLFGPIFAGDGGDFTLRASNRVGDGEFVPDESRGQRLPILTVDTSVPERSRRLGDRTILSYPVGTWGHFKYQWMKDGNDIPGATDANYIIDPIRRSDAGLYSVRVRYPWRTSSTVHAFRLSVSNPPPPPPEAVAPAITSQPAAATVEEGGAATFSVMATGTAPLSYQWSKDGGAIAGATGATYEIASVWPNNAGSYAVTVSNAAGSVTSAAAVLTVTPVEEPEAVAPEITAQPASMMITVGDDATFSVAATGTAPLAYQWRKDGVAIAGPNAPVYPILDAQLTDAGTYSVVVTNEAGSAASAAAVLAVTPAEDPEPAAPEITAQPASATVEEGSAASFSVSASGTEPLAYQWSKDGTDIAGATSSTYAIAEAGLDDAGSYAVTVTNEVGSAASAAATLTVTPAEVIEDVAPEITSQPVARMVVVGGDVTFTVSATGTAPLFFEWLRNGMSLPGAIGPSGSSLVITDASLDDAGSYSVVVSNEVGSVTSAPASLTVTETAIAPSIVAQPASATIVEGSAASFSVTVIGTEPFTYQWSKEGTDIAGATDATYEIASAWPGDAGWYAVTVSNEGGNAVSSAATLTVTAMEEPSRLSNLSVRTTLTPSQTLVVGAVVRGGSKDLLIRAAGPALDGMGIDGLPDPELSITLSRPGGPQFANNDDWDSALADTFAAAGAFPFEEGSKDAAYLVEDVDGPFTVNASGDGGTGVVLVEAYDLSPDSPARLVNVSARHFAGAGDDTFIAGFAIAGTESFRVLVRAIGPGLAAMGVPGTLADPMMTVLGTAGDTIMSNDDWNAALTETFEATGAFPLADGSKDAALVLDLDPGSYTVQVTGADATLGMALIEIYVVAP